MPKGPIRRHIRNPDEGLYSGTSWLRDRAGTRHGPYARLLWPHSFVNHACYIDTGLILIDLKRFVFSVMATSVGKRSMLDAP